MYGEKLHKIIKSYFQTQEKDGAISVFAKDNHGRILACNKMYYQLAELSSQSQMIGKTAAEISAWQDMYSFCMLGEEIVLVSGSKYLSVECFPCNFGNSNKVVTEKEPIIIDGKICGLMGRSKPLIGELKVSIVKDKFTRDMVTIENGYFHTIKLSLKLFKILIYATWYQLDYKAIANLLFCSESTVKKHFGALYDSFSLYDQERNLYQLKKIANLFLSQAVVDLCFQLPERTPLFKRPDISFSYACL